MKYIECIKRIKYLENKIKNKMLNDNLEKYNKGKKIHLKQIEFHKCIKKNRWVFGGNRSGKTECGAVETIWIARGNHPYRENRKNTECWVVSLSTQVQRDVAQNKILYYLNKEWISEIVMLNGKKSSAEFGVIDFILIKNVFGGLSKIGFKSCDQGREKFQGTSLDYIWFDEEPPYDIYLECKMRVLDKCGEIFGTMTPLKGLSWVYNIIYLNDNNDDEVWHIHINWEDNPFLDKTEIKRLSNALNIDELNSRKYGLFSNASGIVYNEFDEKTHIIEPFKVPCEWFDKISIDPGLHNPLSCHFYAVDFDGNVYVIAEHYEAEKDIIYHANKIRQIAENLNWRFLPNGNLEALIDSAANQRTLSSVKSVSEIFFENGISANSKVNKDIYSGIQRVKSYLKNTNGDAKLFIFKNCVNMIREIKGYFWANGDTPRKSDDHSMDELRYYIMSRPDMPFKKLEKSIIQKDKEKLIKQLNLKNKF